ncbi:MAG: aminopeptidase [Rubrivivax sp.]|jgi:predicted aminopeptidase
MRRVLGWACAAGVAAAALLGLGGCSTLGYYGQAVGGHLDLLQRARPVADWVADPATPEPLRQRLLLTQRLRDFAVAELHLPDNRSYRAYADLQRPAVVWNVVAAPELSLQLKTWCFPVMGCVGYRGYFSAAPAEAEAQALREQGWEASVYGVPAYSTLGWSSWLGGDPLLNTFVHWPEGELARLLFHELAHQVAYASDDTTFNESFAGAVERLGGQRWLQQHGSEAARAEYAALDARRQDFRAMTARTREALQAVYTGPGTDEHKRQAKAALMAQLREEHARLKAERWNGFAGYDGWVQRANNAAFGVQAAYNELVPQFEALFHRLGGDFPRFYAEVQRLARLPAAQRRAALATAAGL